MSGTTRTRREAFDGVADELERLARDLGRRDRQILDALLADAGDYGDAVDAADPPDPWVAALLCVCLAQQRALVDAGLAPAVPGAVPAGFEGLARRE